MLKKFVSALCLLFALSGLLSAVEILTPAQKQQMIARFNRGGLTAKYYATNILSPAETHQLADMLDTAGFDSTDVNFLKDWDPTTQFKLNWQVKALNSPWTFLDLLSGIKDAISYMNPATPDSLILPGNYWPSKNRYYMQQFAEFLDMDYQDDLIPIHWMRFKEERAKIKSPKDCFEYAEFVMKQTEKSLKDGFRRLNPAERDSLTWWLYSVWQEGQDSLEYKEYYNRIFPVGNPEVSTDAAIRLLKKVDFHALSIAWSDWERAWSVFEYKVDSLDFDLKKPLYHKSKWGVMLIGSKENNQYTKYGILNGEPLCFIIEPGGNDTYDIPISTDWEHPFYVVMDLKGDDVYRNRDIGGNLSVLAGCGWQHDYEGNDMYQGGDCALSARLGYQVSADDKGNDVYSSGLFSQSAAMFGLSVLRDSAGNDTYLSTEFSQGLGGTKGLALLTDFAGNDVYYCGGKYLHEPLAPFDYRSMAQGFGFGMRPDLAGGIGVLYDGEGNDRYSGGVYAQGVAYWYAIGALFDEKGNDYYDAVYYPQGSGIHLANGALVDMEGEDHYYSKHGPGQGNGHDWSVGVFVDKKGNDEYSIEGGNGLGLTNSVGIFVDSEGDDKYEQRNPSNYGFANAARETGGLGLFLDAGGKDVYPDSAKADNKTWQSGTYGIGRDIELNTVQQTKVEALAEQSITDVDSLASIDKLFAIASEWEVGSAAKRVQLAREYLIKRDREAVPYAIKTKLDTKSGLEYRALEELVRKSDLMLPALYPVLHNADSLKVKNAMALIATKGDSLAVDSIAVFLKQNKYIPACLSALGGIRTNKALELILPWTAHHTEKYRYLAARALKANGSAAALQHLRQLKQDSSFLIKAMVRQLPPETP